MTFSTPTDLAGRRARAEALASRVGGQLLDLKVAEKRVLTKSMLRIGLTSLDLVGFSALPGQDLMITVDESEASTVRRRYSICHLDSASGTVDLDIIVHGDGPGSRWATDTRVGEVVEAIGPRGKVTLDEEASWHLFLGDDAFLPAAFAMMEAASGGLAVDALFEVQDDTGERFGDTGGARIQWVHRGKAEPGATMVLVDALGSFQLRPGRGFVYMGGEHLVVRALKDQLLARGVNQDQMSAKAYWRRGAPNADHGEPSRD